MPPAGTPATLQTTVSNEDCLHVSVWTPTTKSSKPWPVFAWIHGGGYIEGTIFSQYYDGRYISLLGDVVVVSINYRLDTFGFLYFGTHDSPGNMGLHDQILALKWIQENIAHFGGDPASVTLGGESAGSFSVGSLLLSPLASGLFHRAIMQSGAPNSYSGSSDPNHGLEVTKQFAAFLKCPQSDDLSKALSCLRQKSVPELLNARVSSGIINLSPVWGDLDGQMPIRPVEALKGGHFNHNIDLLYGINKNEGSSFLVQLFNLPQFNPDQPAALTLDNTKQLITLLMGGFGDHNPSEVAEYYTRNFSGSDQDEMRLLM